MLYLGCAVWAFPGWVGDFYPAQSSPGKFLRLYGERLTAVEGNTTFYSIPDQATVKRWAEQVPKGFRFCPKLPRVYSHQGPLLPHLPAVLKFLDLMASWGDRLGPTFVQLPPTYSPAALADLSTFLQGWPVQRVPVSVEVRHLNWFRPEPAKALNQMLQDLGVGRVLLDTRPIYDCLEEGQGDPQIKSERRKPKVPLQPVVTAPFTLVRYISHPELGLNQPYLAEWVERLHQWLTQGTDVYLFVHCPDEARSPAIARHLYNQLQAIHPDLTPLPWNQIAPDPAQLSLF
ncbi:MAG: DUF72 domain-containing protein [Cyanobacteria bacterium]|nr:DUF72 domain-containing protein [Cyanobacteriota bacterium]